MIIKRKRPGGSLYVHSTAHKEEGGDLEGKKSLFKDISVLAFSKLRRSEKRPSAKDPATLI